MAIKRFVIGFVGAIFVTAALQCSDTNAPFPDERAGAAATVPLYDPASGVSAFIPGALPPGLRTARPLPDTTGEESALVGDESAEQPGPPPSVASAPFVINMRNESDDDTAGRSATSRRSSAARTNLAHLRNQEVKEWGHLLMKAQFWWYRAGNVAECLSQICQVVTPILAGCAGTADEKDIALSAMVIGACGVGLGRFSAYAYKESAERGKAANLFLKDEGVPEIVVLVGNT